MNGQKEDVAQQGVYPTLSTLRARRSEATRLALTTGDLGLLLTLIGRDGGDRRLTIRSTQESTECFETSATEAVQLQRLELDPLIASRYA